MTPLPGRRAVASFRTGALLALCLSGGMGAARAGEAPCSALNSAALPLDGYASQVSIQATDIPAGGLPLDPLLPEFCLVDLVVSSTGDTQKSQIAIGVVMPATGWNGRFLGTGVGGFGGALSDGSLVLGLAAGYATANTDLGTGLLFKCTTLFCGSAQGIAAGTPLGGPYGDGAAIKDFGFGATHLMTLAGKQLVALYYGRNASYSYFHGCSTGGQQALMEAQRFPADYDGILAGSPAYDRTHLHVGGTSIYLATHAAPDAYLTNAALALAHQGVLAQCAGKDGGLATDDFLTRPASCAFDAAALQCTGASGEVPCTDPNGTSCTCLTADQAAALDQDWSGATDDHGHILYPGFERGTEEPVPLTAANSYTGNYGLTWQEAGTEPAFDSLEYWAFGPDFTWQSLYVPAYAGVLVGKIKLLDQHPVAGSTMEHVLNATSTDLSAFKAHGGKLLMYAGYADPLIPTASTIDYYNGVAQADRPNLPSYLRLFLAPGMWHCSGGPGANAFGNLTSTLPPQPGDPSDDVLAALVAWREQGIAPQTIIATKYPGDDSAQPPSFQRPMCPYPAYARYKAAQQPDPALASSWECHDAALVRNQGFSSLYGPF